VEEVLPITEGLGIETVTSFITGYPEERVEDHQRTLAMAFDLHCRRPGVNASQLHVLTPEPGTDLMARYGDRLLFDPEPAGFNLPILVEEDALLVERMPHLFGNYHCFPCDVPRARLRLSAKLFELLSELTRAEMLFVTSACGGDIDGFISRFAAWHRARSGMGSELDLAEIATFLVDELGPGHPAGSLVRYRAAGLAVAYPDWGRVVVSEVSELDEHSRLTLSSRAALLRRIHDSVPLYDLVAGIPEEGASDLELSAVRVVDLVLLGCDRNDGDRVLAYEVDETAMNLLDEFRTPLSLWGYHSRSGKGDARPDVELQDLSALVDLGILVPATA
jgi:hypothetical protein